MTTHDETGMMRDTQIELIERCLHLATARAAVEATTTTANGRDNQPSSPPPGEHTRLDVARYTDPARFARELELLFRRAPLLVAHSGELSRVGAFVTRDCGGVPTLIVRSEAGIKAFINVCRHRGATVELRPSGSCKRFVCPYHAWSYDLDGALVHVRHRDGFPALDVDGLVPLPCFERAGWVFVVADPTAAGELDLPAPLADELAGLDADSLERVATHTRRWRTNWKLIADGGLESYHFKVAHRESIAKYFLDTVSMCEFFGGHSRTIIPRTSMLALADTPREHWQLRAHANILYGLFPSVSLLVQADHVVMVASTPLAVDETRVEISTLVPRHERERERYWQANHELTVAALIEDFELAEHIQRGMTSGANTHLQLGRFEHALAEFHAFIDARLELG